MIKLASAAVLTSAALALAACGGGGGGGGSSAASGAVGDNGGTVAVQNVDGVGDALVSAGMTLYTPDLEAGGMIRCTGACTKFWTPLEPAGGKPVADGDAGRLGVIKRPDGTRQITSNGLPLYTFSEDGPGDASGNGFTDDFSGRHFTWHAVLAGGKPASAGGGGSPGGGGYSGGGY